MSLPNRKARVARQVHRLMQAMLLAKRYDPLFQDLQLAHVEMSSDLSCARLLVRSYQRPSEAREAWLRALNQEAATLRRELTPRLNLKRSPELRFCYDQEGEDLDTLLATLADVPDQS